MIDRTVTAAGIQALWDMVPARVKGQIVLGVITTIAIGIGVGLTLGFNNRITIKTTATMSIVFTTVILIEEVFIAIKNKQAIWATLLGLLILICLSLIVVLLLSIT